MVYALDIGDITQTLTPGMNSRITSSIAYQIQVQRQKWLRSRLELSHATDLVITSRKPWDSALTTVVFLLSCVANLYSCFHLINSISPDDITTWRSPLYIGYLIAPFFITAAGISARYLHSILCTTPLDPQQFILGAVTTTSKLFYLILPAAIVAEWATSSGHKSINLSTFEISLLGLAVCVPMYTLYTGCDDW